MEQNQELIKPIDIGVSNSVLYNDIHKLVPKEKDIPKEFKESHPSNKMVSFINRWFFEGLPLDTEFTPQIGIDSKIAIRHIKTVLLSFKLEHNYKIAACSYLLSLWFKDIKLPPNYINTKNHENKQK